MSIPVMEENLGLLNERKLSYKGQVQHQGFFECHFDSSDFFFL